MTTTEDVIEQVVHTVADATDTDILEIPPLYEAIDPESLEVLCRRAQRDGTPLTVMFSFAGCTVRIDVIETVSVSVDEFATGTTPEQTDVSTHLGGDAD